MQQPGKYPIVEHREVQEQKATISQLKSAVAQQQKDFQETIV